MKREAVADWADRMQFKVSRPDQVNYMCSHSQVHVKRYPKVFS